MFVITIVKGFRHAISYAIEPLNDKMAYHVAYAYNHAVVVSTTNDTALPMRLCIVIPNKHETTIFNQL